MSSFQQRVAETAFSQVEEEFLARGRALGLQPQSLAELEGGGPAPPRDERPRDAFAARGGRSTRSGALRPNLYSLQQGGGDDEATQTERAPAPKKRKEIRLNRQSEPIDLVDDATGEIVTIRLRRVPSTEIPYLDRLELQLQNIRHQLSTMRAKTTVERRRVDDKAGEYNEVMEEMICFSVEGPPGFYSLLDATALNELQREIKALVAGARQTRQEETDEGN